MNAVYRQGWRERNRLWCTAGSEGGFSSTSLNVDSWQSEVLGIARHTVRALGRRPGRSVPARQHRWLAQLRRRRVGKQCLTDHRFKKLLLLTILCSVL